MACVLSALVTFGVLKLGVRLTLAMLSLVTSGVSSRVLGVKPFGEPNIRVFSGVELRRAEVRRIRDVVDSARGGNIRGVKQTIDSESSASIRVPGESKPALGRREEQSVLRWRELWGVEAGRRGDMRSRAPFFQEAALRSRLGVFGDVNGATQVGSVLIGSAPPRP